MKAPLPSGVGANVPPAAATLPVRLIVACCHTVELFFLNLIKIHAPSQLLSLVLVRQLFSQSTVKLTFTKSLVVFLPVNVTLLTCILLPKHERKIQSEANESRDLFMVLLL